jgi:hypothetical protein
MRQIHGVLAVILCVTAPWAAFADDYTFKRVKVGEGLPGKRITVQIDPEEQAAYLAALPKVDPNPEHETKDDTSDKTADSDASATPAPASSYAWFWDKVPSASAKCRAGSTPPLPLWPWGRTVRWYARRGCSTCRPSPRPMGQDILKATLDTNVSPALVLAVMGVESGGNPEAVSSAGAVGLMQLIPATAERFGVTDSTDPVQNIKGGVAYLDWLMKRVRQRPADGAGGL